MKLGMGRELRLQVGTGTETVLAMEVVERRGR